MLSCWQRYRLRSSKVQTDGFVLLLFAVALSGCSATDYYLQQATIEGSPVTVPVHVRLDTLDRDWSISARATIPSFRVLSDNLGNHSQVGLDNQFHYRYLRTNNDGTISGESDGSNTYDFRGENFSWRMPSAWVQLEGTVYIDRTTFASISMDHLSTGKTRPIDLRVLIGKELMINDISATTELAYFRNTLDVNSLVLKERYGNVVFTPFNGSAKLNIISISGTLNTRGASPLQLFTSFGQSFLIHTGNKAFDNLNEYLKIGNHSILALGIAIVLGPQRQLLFGCQIVTGPLFFSFDEFKDIPTQITPFVKIEL